MVVVLSIFPFIATLLVAKRINGTVRQERLAVVFGSLSFAILSVIVFMIVAKIEPIVWFFPFIVVFMVLNAIAGLSLGAISLRRQTNDRKQALLGMSLSGFSLIAPSLLFVLRMHR